MTCLAAERVGWGRLGNTHRDTEREASRQTLPALSRGVCPPALVLFPGCSLFLATDGDTGWKMRRDIVFDTAAGSRNTHFEKSCHSLLLPLACDGKPAETL
ncbi:hypothetical protein FQN60_004411 [Etheostoma spectabile]|uniref:Uncharacterized protein n=1 Tax=Etheostoma spectabile TaxID=54343 RepID=A0A5J5CVC8_9PERO|nr:hypothetical protein FQN60_004411 [Etheostoma spectabile]